MQRSRPADRPRVAGSTTGSPARSAGSRPTPRSSTSTSTRPSWARSAGPTSPIVGDCRLVIEELVKAVRELGRRRRQPDRSAWKSTLSGWQEKYPLAYEQPTTGDALKPQFVLEHLRDYTPDDTIVASGVGQHQMWASQYWKFNHPYTWVNSGGLGTMGFSVPAAIGAKVGRPDRMVWAVDGDGCFQMTAQELVTAAAERIPIKVAILNNAYLGMVRQWQEMFYDERYSEVYLSPDLPDYVKWAEAMGCVGFRVESPEEVLPPSTRPTRSTTARSSSTSAPTAARRCSRWSRPAVATTTSSSIPARAKGATDMTASSNVYEHQHHTLSVLVENKAGVLARVAGLFARRGFNIYSLAVAPTDDERFSRITIVVDVESAPLEQITKQLFKLINVVKISELDPRHSVERELLLATVEPTARPAARSSSWSRLRGPHPRRRPRRDDRHARRPALEARRLRGAAPALRDRRAAAHRPGGAAEARTHSTEAPDRFGPSRLTLKGSITWPTCTTRRTPTGRSSPAARWRSIGYGSQGHAHALNLKDSGVDVRVGLRDGSSSKAKAEEAGLRVLSLAEAAAEADLIMILLPDTEQQERLRGATRPEPLERRRAVLRPRLQRPLRPASSRPTGVDVGHGRARRARATSCAAPTPRAAACRASSRWPRTPSGKARDLALSYADAIGGTRAGVLETTFEEETETDLFGEQVVLCGGLTALVQAGFETLVEAGYQPESAYFECLHELKLIVDLMYEQGIGGMRYSISDTAEYGDLTRGPRIINDAVKAEMQTILDEIQSGKFAEEWIAESEAAGQRFNELREAGKQHQIEQVGAELRAMMPWISAGKQSVEDASGGGLD